MTFDVRKAKFAQTKQWYADEKQEDVDSFLTLRWMQALKPPKETRDMLHEEKRALGLRYPFMTTFRSAFPNFPIYVDVRRKIPLQKNASLAMLFPQPRAIQQKFVEQFKEMLIEQEHEIAGRASAMLISWPGRLPVALHNLAWEKEPARVCFYLSDGNGFRVTLEPITQLAELISPRLTENYQ